jgi:hypothetical protein
LIYLRLLKGRDKFFKFIFLDIKMKFGFNYFKHFFKTESKKKYEVCLLIGTFFTFSAFFLLHFFGIGLFFFWGVAIFGKVLVVLSIMGYIRYRKFSEGIIGDPLYTDLKKVAKKVPLVKKGGDIYSRIKLKF